MGAERSACRATHLALLLMLLMVAAPLTPFASVPPTDEGLSDVPVSLESAPFSGGNGEQLAGETLIINASDWLVAPARGLDRWDYTNLNTSVNFDHVDLARDDRGRARGCLHEAAGGIWVARLEFGGGTSVTQIESGGQNLGNHCSIAIDGRELLHLAYTDANDNLRVGYELAVATASGRTWNIRTVENETAVAGGITLLLDGDGNHNVLWLDANDQLWLSTFTTWWTHTPLMTGIRVAVEYDAYLEPNGDLNLFYRNLDSYQLIHGIRNSTGSWDLTTIDSGASLGPALAFAKDPASGNIQYTYADGPSTINIVRDLKGQESGRLHPGSTTIASGLTTTDYAEQAFNTLDFDCDGFDDLVVSEAGANSDTGAVHVFWGSSSGLEVTPYDLTGLASGERFGASVANAGDVDGDGCEDLIVGVTGGKDNLGYTTGLAYVYHGGGRNHSAANWSKTGGTGPSANGDEFGGRVSSAGDVNGDGFDDVMVTAIAFEQGGFKGKVYLYLGGSGGLAQSPIWNTRGYWSNVIQGWSLAAIGDSNGDGFDDIALGASGDLEAVSGYGRVQVYSGSSTGLMAVQNQWHHLISYTFLGYSVAGLGDVNGDNYSDFAFGEPNHDSSALGKVHVLLGSASGYPDDPDLELVGTQTGQLLGSAIGTIGDLNDDGREEVAISSIGLGTQAGKVELFYADSSELLRPALNPILIVGVSGQHLGRTVSGGGDVDGDGEFEILVTSTDKDMAGNDAGAVIQLEKRNTERSSISKSVTSLDLDLDDQGRFHLLVRGQDGTTHLERPNSALNPDEPWQERSHVTVTTVSAMVVTRSGKAIVLAGNSFLEQSANVLLSNSHPLIANRINDFDLTIYDDQSHLFYSEYNNATIDFVKVRGETDSGFLTTNLGGNSSSMLPVNGSAALVDVNGSGWDLLGGNLSVTEDFLGSSSCLLPNGTAALVYSVAGSGETTLRLIEEGGNSSTSPNSSTSSLKSVEAVAVDTACEADSAVLFALQTASGTISLSRWSNGTVTNLDSSTSTPNGVVGAIITQTGSSASALFPDFSASGDGVLLGQGTTDAIGYSDFSKLSAATGADGTTWLLHDGGNNLTTLSILEGLSVRDVWSHRSTSTSQLLFADMEVDSDGVVRFAIVETDGALYRMNSFRIYGDWDRDFVPVPWDDVPYVGGQWNDSDGDGYGDNVDGPVPDSCATASGTSRWGHFGCADYDGDGWANGPDACFDRDGHSHIDRFGCPDPDGDGWSSGDETTVPGSADADPLNWYQSQDSDGDNRMDNHGPDCCGVGGSSDYFPLNGNQWSDADEDGWGDQSDFSLANLTLQAQHGRDFGRDDIPNTNDPDGSEGDAIYDYYDTDWDGDQCPGEQGFSAFDRGGCSDTDGDGWSDPHASTGPNDRDWLYNRSLCHGISANGHIGCADNWPGGGNDGEPCADLSNCSDQWHDLDGDGYGDNSTFGAWLQDAFPTDVTQWNDSDLDGYGDNQAAGATAPDICPVDWGNSTVDRLGCPDSDGDGYSDPDSSAPAHPVGEADSNSSNPEQWRDNDGDGFGDFSNKLNGDQCPTEFGYLNGEGGRGCPLPEQDQDGDGIIDEFDVCANTTMGESVDTSGAWLGCSENQKDDDGDGVSNAEDNCANTTLGATVDEVGCSEEQLTIDSDLDGVFDVDDECPDTPTGLNVSAVGCAPEQLDEDDDGISNAVDECPGTAGGAVVDEVGCPRSDMDSDGDGYTDDIDKFPTDPSQWADLDNDGYGNNGSGTNGDDCVSDFGNSTLDRLGCPDNDGDGYSNPDGNWLAHPQGQADAFPDEVTQWRDTDQDGFGDDRDGFEADQCPTDAGVKDGVNGVGCPVATSGGGGGTDDCSLAMSIYDPESWNGDASEIPTTYHDCSWYMTWYGSGEKSGPNLMMIGGIGGAVLLMLLLTLLAVRFLRGGDEWDDDVEDDLFEGGPAQTRAGSAAWSVPGSVQEFGGGFGDSETADLGTGRMGRARNESGQNAAAGRAARPGGGPPGRGGAGPPAGGGGGPPGRGGAGPSRARPTGGGGPSARAPAGDRPGPPTGGGPGGSAAAGAGTAKVARRKVVKAAETEEPPTRKVRKTKAVAEAPKRATRKSRAKKAAPSNWEDLFSGADSANYTRSLGLTKESVASGEEDRNLLRTLQTEGWSAKQSRWILDDARNS
jgi:hypothetical protein